MTKPAANAPNKGLTSGLRKYLYFTAGTTGAAILVVEILGAKMLSPYVGTSHFVWTAQIAVTLVSLALGYYFGGWLVDRSPKLDNLFFCIGGAAAYLAATVLFVEKVAYAFLHLNLAVGALAASAFLFFVPLTLLAAVGPFAIRMLTLSFQVIGRQVGRLSAISTLGSVLGTILIGYVLLPLLPNSVTMLATAGVLFSLSLFYFAIWRRSGLTPLLLLTGIGFALGGLGLHREQTALWDRVTEVYRSNSHFGMLQVIETKDGHRRFFLNDYLIQNTYDPERNQSTSLFTYMLEYLARGYAPKLEKVLCIGLGVGIVPRNLVSEGVEVDAVEINPDVVELARSYFDFDASKVRVIIGDGRYVVNKSTNRYDAIVLDAFLGDSSPSHLMTKEAFENMRRILSPNGVLVINSFGSFDPGRNFFTSSLFKTLSSVFPVVRIHASGNGNVFFAASLNPSAEMKPISTAAAHPEIRKELETCLASVVTPALESGRILTDDFNPVEFYDADNREESRRRLAFAIRPL